MISQQHIKHIPGLGHRVEMYERTEDGVTKVLMDPVDAQHALEADPKRWSVEPPVEPEPEPEVEPEADEDED